MHTELAGGAALVAFIFLKNGQNESLLEFADSFRIKNIAFVHLHDQGFELVSHGISLSGCNTASKASRRYEKRYEIFVLFSGGARQIVSPLTQQVQPLVEASSQL